MVTITVSQTVEAALTSLPTQQTLPWAEDIKDFVPESQALNSTCSE